MADHFLESRVTSLESAVVRVRSDIEDMKRRNQLATEDRWYHCELTSFDLVMLLLNVFLLAGVAHGLGWL